MSGSPIAGSPFSSLAAAITAVNGLTITGPVVVTAAAGSETNPAGGYSITATGTVTNTIIIQGAGAGSTLITAPSPAGTAGNLNDAIFKIIGGDYITFQGFSMNENGANTTTAAASNNMVEWGVALLYATTTNGAQNNTIQNCSITLNRTYQNTFGIYANSTHSATAVTTSASATTTAGGNSGLKVYGNTISNVNLGIVVVGPTAAADMNTGIDIGGIGGAQANTISNFGTTGTFSAYANVSGTVNGILVRNSNGFNISYNSITSSAGGTTAGTLNGIQVPAASNTPTGTFTNNINNNTIALQSGVATGAINGITYPSGSASTTSVANMNNNNFTQLNHSVTASGNIIGITIASTNLTTSISSNTFTNLTTNTTGSFTFISASYSAPSNGTKTINGNSIVTAFNKTGAGGTVSLYTDGGSSTTGTSVQNNNNNFSNITLTGATIMTGWFNNDGTTSTPVKTVTGNTFSNWTCGTSSVIVLQTNFGGNLTLSNNTISNITGQGAVTAILRGSSGTVAQTDIASNSISNITSTGTGGTVIGVNYTHASTLVNINNNSISSLASTGATVSGINSTLGTTVNIFKNNVYNLSSANTNAVVSGIGVGGGTTVNVYNNFVSDLRATASTGLNSVIGLNISGGTTANVSYNTVYLGSAGSLTGGATFGGSGVYVISTTALNLKNNIINVKGSGATGYFSALKRSTGTGGTKPSNITATNNIYFVSPQPYIYGEGTTLSTATNVYYNAASGYTGTADPNFNTTCGLYKSWMQENGTFWEDNLTATTPTGAFVPSGTSYAESNATSSTTPSITDDFSGTTRAANPDCGALEFSGTGVDAAGPSITYTNIPNPPNICAAVILSATITDPGNVNTAAGTAPRLWYKKQGNADVLPATNDNTTDGWKYVEAAGTGPYTFTVDYTKLSGGVAGGDVIQYFVVAQDLVGTPNVSTVSANYAAGFCPTSVALASGAFPLANTTGLRTFTLPAFGTATAGTTTASPATLCVSGTASIGMTPTSGTTTGFVFDVQSSPAGAGNWTTIATGLTILPYTTATITASTDFQVIAKDCNGTTLFTSALVAVTVNSPMVTGTTPATRCGTGTVTLGATGSAPLTWYAAASGGASLGMGTTYTTTISSTTNFYVEAGSGSTTNGGKLVPEASWTGSTFSNWGIVFNVLNAGNLNSVDVYSSAAGTLTVKITDASLNTLFTTSAVAVANGGTTTPTTIPINYTLPVGTGYRILVSSSSGVSLIRGSTNLSFPYTDANLSITSSEWGGTTTGTYYYFYNFNFTSGCSSPRTAVTATVTPPPALTLSAASSSICLGTPSAAVTVTSTPGDFNTYTWNPATGVSGDQNSGFIFNPTTSTNYTLTAVQTGGQMCQNTASHSVTVNPVPANAGAGSNSPVCSGSNLNLTSSADPLAGVSNYLFAASSGTYTAVASPTTVHSSGWDDANASVTLPFTFVFNNTSYTAINVNSNGYITFGATTPATTNYTPISESTLYAGAISAFGRDMISNSSTVVSGVEGISPNRTFIIQWNNARRYDGGAVLGDVFNFQIRLSESTNVIQIVYGTCTATSTTSYTSQVGLRGSTNTDFNNRTATTGWASTSTGSTNLSNMTSTNVILPASGQTYTFTPPAFSYSWAGPNSFTSMAQNPTISGITSLGAGTYTVTVTNTSTGCSSTASVTVTVNASIGGTVASAQTITSGSSPADLTLSSQTGNVIRWEYSTDAAFTTPVTISNTTTTLTSAEMGPLTSDRWYRAVVQNGSCPSANSASVKITVVSASVAVSAKVFLSNVSGGTMPGDLRTLGVIPANDPYADTGLPYAATGNFTFVPSGQMATTSSSVINANNVIDWVFVELRTGSSGATSVVASKSGLLKDDGSIINPDGTAFSFTGVAAGNYFVAIKHRNHCGFMTDAATALPNASLLDFTNGSLTLYEPNHAALNLVGSVYAMWTGDVNSNTSVDGGDVNIVRSFSGLIVDVYHHGDVNLNGQVDGADVNLTRANSGLVGWQID